MKSFLSVKGVLLVMLLLVVALGSGTALADRQASMPSQDSLTRTDGATIVTSSICTSVDAELKIWGSGFASGEFVLLSVIKDSRRTVIWFAGTVNVAGAFERDLTVVASAGDATGDNVRNPGTGLFTLEAFSESGRLATTPIVLAEEKCPGSDSMDSMDSM